MTSGPEARVSMFTALVVVVFALAASAGLSWFGYMVGIAPFPPLDLADLLIRLSPGELAAWAITNLQFMARTLAQVAGLAALPLAALLAALYLRRFPSPWSGLHLAAAGSVLCVLLALAIGTASGALEPIWLIVWFTLTLAGPLALAGNWMERLQVDAVERLLAPPEWLEVAGDRTRREVLRNAVLTGIGIGGLGWLGGTVARSSGIGDVATAEGVPLDQRRSEIEDDSEGSVALPQPLPADDLPDSFIAPDGVRSRMTPDGELFVIDITTRKPVLPDSTWTLKVHGLVERELELTYLDLLSMPAVEIHGTLMCISFTYDNHLIGTARWTGVPLRDVLQRCGIGGGAVDLVLKGAGGYSDSIPVAKALERNTLLAYGMNGTTLPIEHGFPCRLYVPDIYGEKNVKWLQEIEIVDYDYLGYWQERGWSDAAVINTISTIDTPQGDTLLNDSGVVPVGGITFAGSRGVQSVRLRIDNGEWQETDLEPYDPELLWQRWRFDWDAQPGEHRITVQATDWTGAIQETDERDPYPDGMTGLHSVRVRAIEEP